MPTRIPPALSTAALLLALAAPAPGQLVLSEVLFDPEGVDTNRQVLEVRNLGETPVEVGGHWLSFKPASWKFPAGASIPPLGTVVIHLNRAGAGTDTVFYTGTSGMRTLRRDDSISLFRQNLFSDPTQLVDYVEWGTPGQSGEDVAVEAGKWQAFTAVSVAALRDGSSIARQETGSFASAWCIDGTPSLGSPADECTVSHARSPVRLNEVRPGPGSLVELKNVGGVLEDLEGKWLLAGSSSYRFPAGTILVPGDILLVRVGVAGVDGPEVLHTGPGFQPLGANGSVALYASSVVADSTFIFDFLQWGAAGAAFEAQAVEAGIWSAGESVDVALRVAGGSLSAVDEGSGPTRWRVDNTPTPGDENDAAPVSEVHLNEVLLLPEAGGRQAVELFNRSSADLDVGGWTLCTRSSTDPAAAACASLPAGSVIPREEFLVVVLGPGPVPAGQVALDLPVMLPAGGEMALLVHPDASLVGNFLDYLRWGNSEPVLEAQASRSGLWEAGESIDAAAMPDGSSLAREGAGRGPEAYRIDASPSLGAANAERPLERDFVRADCNQDGSIDLSDPISAFGFLFFGAEAPSCRDACDANDDASLDISDPIYTLSSLFLGGSPQKPPSSCGPDPTPDEIYCQSFRDC